MRAKMQMLPAIIDGRHSAGCMSVIRQQRLRQRFPRATSAPTRIGTKQSLVKVHASIFGKTRHATASCTLVRRLFGSPST